jgi:hypothetical protein
MVLLRKNVPQNHNLKTAAELGVMRGSVFEAKRLVRPVFVFLVQLRAQLMKIALMPINNPSYPSAWHKFVATDPAAFSFRLFHVVPLSKGVGVPHNQPVKRTVDRCAAAPHRLPHR